MNEEDLAVMSRKAAEIIMRLDELIELEREIGELLYTNTNYVTILTIISVISFIITLFSFLFVLFP